MELKQALSQLDPANDGHWTSNGSPRVDVISEMIGATVTRQAITDAAPELMRESAAEIQIEEEANAEAQEAKRQVDGEAHEAEGEGSVDPEVATAPGAEAPWAPDEGVEVKEQFPKAPRELVAESNHELPPRPNDAAIVELQSQIDAISAKRDAALKSREAADKEFKVLNDEVNIMNRQIEHLSVADPNRSIRGIKAYLKSQHDLRMKRAIRAGAILGNMGVTAGELQKELTGKSRLDQAMAQRKPARGAQRPVYNPMSQK
jgi:hypothetical protein